MDDITTSKFEELCLEAFRMRDEIDQKKNELAALSQGYEELGQEIILYLDALGKDKHHTAVGTLSVQKRLSYRVPKDPESKEQFFGFLKDKGIFEDMITVNANTLNAFAKKELEAAADAGCYEFKIPGLGDPTHYERISIRRKK